MNIDQRIHSLDQLTEQGAFRTLKKRPVGTPLSKEPSLSSYALDFASNDYLGLANDDELRNSLIHFLEQKNFPLCSSSSRLIAGHNHHHETAELQLAHFFNAPSGLLFNSGYSANTGVLSTLCKEAIVFSDELNHASLIDGIRLSRAECKVFKHNDVEHLKQLLENTLQAAQTSQPKPLFVVTESLFSMDGDLAPLDKLVKVCQQYNAWLVIDEAHAGGTCGNYGEGLASEISFEKLIRIYTFGKAFASYGAFVACPTKVTKLLINFCRDFIFTTALPPHVVEQTLLSIQFVKNKQQLLNRLKSNCEYFQKKLSQLEIEASADSPVFPIIVGSNEKVLRAEQLLLKKNIQVSAIRYPTVPRSTERLRVCVHANHTEEQIDLLVDSLKEVL